MILVILLVVLVLLIVYYLYKDATRNEDYYKQRGIPYLKPSPFVGNSGSILFDSDVSMNDFVAGLYNALPDEKAYGTWHMRNPILMIRDPALLKMFAIEHAADFQDHVPVVDEISDELFGNSLFALKGQKWRDMRAALMPAFSACKVRLMFELVDEVCGQMMSHLSLKTESGAIVDFEMKDICSRFTSDIIALCAFGIKVDSLEDRENEFFKIGEDIHNLGKTSTSWKVMGIKTIPWIMRLLNVKFFGKAQPFFKNIVLNTMMIREREQMYRPDMIHLLMEIRSGRLSHGDDVQSQIKWTDDEIVAQCFLFLFAGFDTTSSPMAFAIYELAVNPEIQQKLYEEILATNEELRRGGQSLNYDILQNMKYMHQVISETLRMHPPAPYTDRICVKDCVVEDGEGFRMECTKDMGIWIPICALHRDPRYFSNPNTFDPERFSEENRHLIDPDTYIPFGIGPRRCIGIEFGLIVIKALIYRLCLNFTLNVVEKTQIPIKLKRSFGTILTEKGIWVGIQPRAR